MIVVSAPQVLQFASAQANHLFHSRQILRQRLAARMRLALAHRLGRKRLAARFGFHFIALWRWALLGQ